MNTQSLPVYFPDFLEATKKLTASFVNEPNSELSFRLKAHPLGVLEQFDAPVRQLPKQIRFELESRLRQVDLMDSASCSACQLGLEISLGIVGGVVACAIAIILAPEALAASPLIIAAAAFAGIEAATAATIFLGVIGTFGGIAGIVFAHFIDAMCQSMNACPGN